MQFLRFFTIVVVSLAVAGTADAGIITIDNLDVRSSGVFGHDPDVSAVTINGAAPGPVVTADPVDVQLTYSNLNLDGDASANDAVTFTLRATKFGTDGGNLRAFNQGFDTGFGNLNDLSISVINVSGTTTDSGHNIVFDGFTGANAGAGRNGELNNSVEINGTTVTLANADTGEFEFITSGINFGPTPTVTFDNSTSIGGTIVARNYDLQFSSTAAVPEPSSVALLSVLGALAVLRRSRRNA